MNVIKSISDSEDELLHGLLSLHNGGRPFDLDPCYSIGGFYRSGVVPQPLLRFDAAAPGVEKARVENLPLSDRSVSSIVFDPPFMFNPHGKARDNAANRRFTMFETWADLERTYKGALAEFNRVLKPKGIVAFKCQDYTDAKTTLTHCLVYQWAVERGFYARDIFIRYRHHGAAYNPKLRQKHARKFHSYWFVFEKRTPYYEFG